MLSGINPARQPRKIEMQNRPPFYPWAISKQRITITFPPHIIVARLPVEGLVQRLAAICLGHGRSVHLDGALAVTREVTAAVEPGPDLRALGLVLLDLVDAGHGQANVVETVDQAVLAELLDVELAQLLAVGVADDLVDEVDFDFLACLGFGGDALEGGLVCDAERKHAVLEGVVEEDVAE
jgi:hypothetical protein